MSEPKGDTVLALRPSDEARFWSKVDARGVCWEWTAALSPEGYGRFALPTGRVNIGNGRPAWRAHLPHRIAYELLTGSAIPEGYQIDHLCRNRRCVNPDHLEAVTPQVNTHRSSSLTRYQADRTHCLRGHPLVPPNMYVSSRNRRVCRECYRVRQGRAA